MTGERPLLASQLYALSQSARCEGTRSCHWCSAPCDDRNLHDDHPPIPFTRSKSTARVPSSPYICRGCWLYHRPRLTVHFLTDSFKDGQAPANHSWYITQTGAWGLRDEDHPKLMQIVQSPPLRFVLAFRDGNNPNLLQLMIANDNKEILADTELHYTVNGVVYAYTIYELGRVLEDGSNGCSPGTRELARRLAPKPPPEPLTLKPVEDKENKTNKGGRPPVGEDGKSLKKVIQSSLERKIRNL